MHGNIVAAKLQNELTKSERLLVETLLSNTPSNEPSGVRREINRPTRNFHSSNARSLISRQVYPFWVVGL